MDKFVCMRCGKCCGPHYVSEEEQKQIEAYLTKIGLKKRPYLSIYDKCPYLEPVGGGVYTCLIYPVRPLVCRLMGVIESMPCPNWTDKTKTPGGSPYLRGII